MHKSKYTYVDFQLGANRSAENMRHTEEINQMEVNYERYFNETIT